MIMTIKDLLRGIGLAFLLLGLYLAGWIINNPWMIEV